nr:MAG TPA: hypothetical protein [Caudoviricetes sp.]
MRGERSEGAQAPLIVPLKNMWDSEWRAYRPSRRAPVRQSQ